MSLKAAAPTVAEMVKSWEQPTVVRTAAPIEMTAPTSPPAALSMPSLQIDQAPRAQMKVAIAAPEVEDNVQIDTTPPPPKPKPEIKAKPEVKPKLRPQKKQEQEGRKAKVTSAGVAKQVSAGSGGGAQAGSGSSEVNTGSPGRAAKLQAVWGAKIRARIERNKRYPRGTKASGDVTIRLTVSRDGRLVSHQLTRSSGNPTLDQAALSAVARSKRFPKAPKDLQGNSFRFSVLIRLMPRS
ncbi:energy transducer TonB [Ruegeria sp. MALMAid1280]|uniref:energy transducer TonB n=1 Tax=Ruegeria sp. MALMAid1280 TaxID=3411634 RepID=UPI003BA0FDF0